MKKSNLISGLVKRHPDGFGFLIPDDKEHPDVYIPRHSMNGIMSNDRVLVRAEPERGGERFRGEVERVVARGVRRIVGAFAILNDKEGMIRDEGKGWGEDMRIPLADSMSAKSGDLVAAEIVTYPANGARFTGKIVEVIGDMEDPMNDIRRVVNAHSIPDTFPEDVQAEAARFKEIPDESDYRHRRDLRGKNLITIDGATAKDFDDAVLVEQTEQGFLLYVAIADVSHYVRPGSAIDREAYERGTSVYFPNFVVPMLPEVLSNGLCSLNPRVPRLCMVAEMRFDFTGTMTSSDFYEAVMESKARCTYGQAQEVIDGVDVTELAHVKENILRCADLAKVLMAKRFREGSLDLEIPETQLQIDGAGRPVDVIRSERLFAHRLIEELMLAANVAVAKFLSSKQVPSLYRIHEPPNEMAIQLLEKYLLSFGGSTRFGGGKLQKKLTRALEEFSGRPEAQVVNILTLRSMSQAKYAPGNVGHFGLGFDDYSHFTSPIRRYPDLIVHRLLKSQVVKGGGYRTQSEEDLQTAGAWLSACEQRSVKAERQLMAIKKARFMQSFIGREFDGLVSSVAKFGAFVLLREYDIDGLVRAEEMGDGIWHFDEENLALVAKRSGFSIRVGDTMRVVVASADVSDGKIGFTPLEAVSSRKLRLDKKIDSREAADEKPRDPQREERSHRGGKDKPREERMGRRDSPAKRAEREHRKSRKKEERQNRRQRNEKKHEKKRPFPQPVASNAPPTPVARSQARSTPPAERPKFSSTERRPDQRADHRPEQRDQRPAKNQSFQDKLRRWDAHENRREEPPTGGKKEREKSPKGSGARSLMDVLLGRKAPAAKERNFDRGAETQSTGKNAEERGEAPHDRGGLRKARVSQRGGKGPSGPVPGGKAQRKRRN